MSLVFDFSMQHLSQLKEKDLKEWKAHLEPLEENRIPLEKKFLEKTADAQNYG